MGRETEQRLEEQNRTADEFHRWNRKADGYVGGLTLLAIALSLRPGIGLASRLRLFFALGGIFAAEASLLWSASILILPGGG